MSDIPSRSSYLPKRGTDLHLANRFFKVNIIKDVDLDQELPYDNPESTNTKYIEIQARSMINKVESPDLFMDYSLNPYQGCEHGCVYCYARPTHNYWGYSAADDFENKILVKTNALEILKKELCSRNYQVKVIVLSGNTDCYQPAEKKFRITRSILELMYEWKHPVHIITKNALVLRDLDILKSLAANNLCSVSISVTAAKDSTRRVMEPRASTIESRFKAIKTLSENKIVVNAMLAPIIPGINDTELIEMIQRSAENGAASVGYQIVRLNGDLQEIFSEFLEKQFQDRKLKVLNAIKSCHSGQLNDSRFGVRMKGEGNVSKIINQQFKLAKSKYFPNQQKLILDTSLFSPWKNGQMNIW